MTTPPPPAADALETRLAQIQELQRQVLAKLGEEKPKNKDGWDKLSAIAAAASALFAIVIALLGFYFANMYQTTSQKHDQLLRDEQAHTQDEQAHTQELQAFVQCMPILRGTDEEAKRAAIKALEKFSTPQMFLIVTELNRSSEGVQKGLVDLATNAAKDRTSRDLARAALVQVNPTADVTKGVADLATTSDNSATRQLAKDTLKAICGGERISVKTLTDAGAGAVNLVPVDTTITALRELQKPVTLPQDSRVEPVEKQTFRIHARLVSFAQESDNDFHLVISDERTGETMLAEIPLPDCAPTSSHMTEFRRARDFFTSRFGAPLRKSTSAPEGTMIEITGVGFFDFMHGARGMAPNGIELHPVLSIKAATTSGKPGA